MVVHNKIHIEGKEYDGDDLSQDAKTLLEMLTFANHRHDETANNLSLLRRAKNSYIKDLRNELLSSKTGLLFEDN